MPALHDYRRQALTYDRTRGASPSILAPLERALAGASGRQLLDVAGGTGNYAAALRDRGWGPTVVDVSAEMLGVALGKGLPAILSDAARLAVADRAVDAIVCVSALHLIGGWDAALAEMRRVVRPGGRIALMVYARENLEGHWFLNYFPGARARTYAEHQSLAEIAAHLSGAESSAFWFTDLDDASGVALQAEPRHFLDPAWRAQLSFFERLESRDPAELAAGLARLEADLAAGRAGPAAAGIARARWGDGTIISWVAPG